MGDRENIGTSVTALPAMERLAKGDGSVAKVLTQKPADLTALAAANGRKFPATRVMETVDGWREVVAHGPRDTPVWRRAMRFAPAMLRARMRAIVDYVATLQSK
jgi:hypothetical protein